MKKKEDLRIVKTKANLYRGLMELMKEKTFEEIKVSDICNKSMINRSTFYDHFNDKYELLQSLMEDLKEELEEKRKEEKEIHSIREYYIETINLLLTHITENISIYSSVIKNNTKVQYSSNFPVTVVVDDALASASDNILNPI